MKARLLLISGIACLLPACQGMRPESPENVSKARTEVPPRCSVHDCALQKVGGYVPPPGYEVFPLPEWWEMIGKYPNYDKMLLYDRAPVRTSDKPSFREDLICPECTRQGNEFLARE